MLYREDLENPPLLIVCDMDRFQVHTNFTDTVKRVYDFNLAQLPAPANLDVLRRIFTEPNSLRPDETTARVTEQAAEWITKAGGVVPRGADGKPAVKLEVSLLYALDAEEMARKLPPGTRIEGPRYFE